MQTNHLTAKQRKASYFIISVVMWEFFSYFGMQAMLILYLTQKLHFSDSHAYDLYGNFTSLIFITPILGGLLADKYCGYRYAVMWGCALIICGHLVLGSFTQQGLYVGLALLIIGIGLFKSNAICLIGSCYPNDSAGKSAAFSWYYVSGNLGAIASQLLCPYVAQTISWHLGFMIAAFGMLIGLVILYFSAPYFAWETKNFANARWNKFSHSTRLSMSSIIASIALLAAYAAMKLSLVGYLLVGIGAISIFMYVKIYQRANIKDKNSLVMIAILTLFATAFWVFDQQGTSSVSLFISRYINRTIFDFDVPAGMFQAINPTIILITGVIMAVVWRTLGRKGINPNPTSKLSMALLMLTVGFFVIAHAGFIAHVKHTAAIYYPLISLSIIGAAEIFVDPVLLTAMGDAAPENSIGQLVAIYYLAVGAVANYLAAEVAKLTIDPSTHSANALTYHAAYTQMAYIALGLFVFLLLFITRQKLKIR